MKAVLLWMIRFYRKVISPTRPPCCRFIPTCSAYALEAIKNTAPGRGAFLPCAGFSDAIPFTGRRALSMTPSPDPGQPVSPAGDRRRHPSNLEALQ